VIWHEKKMWVLKAYPAIFVFWLVLFPAEIQGMEGTASPDASPRTVEPRQDESLPQEPDTDLQSTPDGAASPEEGSRENAAVDPRDTFLDFNHTLTVFYGQGSNVDLRMIPGDILQMELDMEHTFFHALNYSYAFYRTGDFRFYPFNYRMRGVRLELEGQLTKHWGLQYNYESHLAIAVRTPDLNPFLGLTINIAYGDGLSYAHSKPSFEDGPDGMQAGPRYKLQHFMGLEVVLGWTGLPYFQLVAKIHHRSGIWGVVAPPGVGSNFITYGVRARF